MSTDRKFPWWLVGLLTAGVLWMVGLPELRRRLSPSSGPTSPPPPNPPPA